MTIIYFILILGITILIHEFGHFIFAKKYGVHVYEFSLGMGPRLFKFNRKNDETDYSIRLFPIGGYVQMAGEEVEVDEKIPVEKRLGSKTIFQRFMIMVAGVMMNFLLALVLYFFIGIFNTVSLNNVYVSDSAISTIEDGSKIVSVNGHFTNNYDKLALELTLVGDNDFEVEVVDKDGNKHKEKLETIKIGKSNLVYGYDYGFAVDGLNIIKSNIPDLKINDKIVSIDGKELKNLNDLNLYLKENNKDTYEFEFINQEGITYKLNINKEKIDSDELKGYGYGFFITGTKEKGFLTGIKYGFGKFFSTIEQMIFTVLYLITGRISLELLSGPVGIFNAVAIYSTYGFTSMVSLLCLICINVGFINILPLPAFDGGHIVFIILEKIRGKRIEPKIENTIHNIFLMLLMVLMIVITYNDITRLF